MYHRGAVARAASDRAAHVPRTGGYGCAAARERGARGAAWFGEWRPGCHGEARRHRRPVSARRAQPRARTARAAAALSQHKFATVGFPFSFRPHALMPGVIAVVDRNYDRKMQELWGGPPPRFWGVSAELLLHCCAMFPPFLLPTWQCAPPLGASTACCTSFLYPPPPPLPCGDAPRAWWNASRGLNGSLVSSDCNGKLAWW